MTIEGLNRVWLSVVRELHERHEIQVSNAIGALDGALIIR